MATDGRTLDRLARERPSNRRVRFRGVEKNQLGLSLESPPSTCDGLVNLGLDHDGGWQLAAN